MKEVRRYHQSVVVEGFLEEVGFEPGVKEWWMMRVGMMREMG